MRRNAKVSTNAVRFEGPRTDHVESYFLKATAPDAARALWIKATIFSAARDPDGAKAEAWAIAFDRRAGAPRHVALKQSVPWSRASFSPERLGIDWLESDSNQGMHLEAGRCRGAISGEPTTGARRIEWDLRFAGDERPFELYRYDWLYRGPVPSIKQLTPYPDLRFQGSLQVGEERWAIDGWRGMQGHNWGRRHAELYAWCHCNQWDGDAELVLEAASARIRLGPVLVPALSAIIVRHRGNDYGFNGVRQFVTTHADLGLRRYTFAAKSMHGKVEGLFEAPLEDFVGLYYPNPAGPMTYCLNSKLARGWLRAELGHAAPFELRTRAAALEVGTRNADHGVRMMA